MNYGICLLLCANAFDLLKFILVYIIQELFCFLVDGSTACDQWSKLNMGTFITRSKSDEKWVKKTKPKRSCPVSMHTIQMN